MVPLMSQTKHLVPFPSLAVHPRFVFLFLKVLDCAASDSYAWTGDSEAIHRRERPRQRKGKGTGSAILSIHHACSPEGDPLEADVESRESLKRAARRVGEEMAGKMEGLIVAAEDSAAGEWKSMREL